MGEQVATKEEEAKKQEESPAPAAAPEAAPAPAPADEKKDEAPPPPAEQDKPKDEPAADPPPPPPPVPVVLGVEVHCTGCAKRIRRSLLRCKGVEAVDVDMAANQVTIKGAVDPQALCDRLRAKTKREATLISPLPPPPPAEGEEPAPPPPPPAPLVSEARTVELLVNMHCEACAQQLQSKMMRMKGVVSAQTDLAAGRLTLSATVDDEKIVEYIHRRTGKIASVVPPPPPEPPKEEEPPAATEPPKEEAPAEGGEKKEEGGDKPAEDGKAAEAGEEKKEGAGEEDQKPGKQEGVAVDGFPPEEMMKRMVYWPYGGAPGGGIHYKLHPADAEEAMMARSMAMHAMPPPLPPPHHHHHNPYGMMHQQHHQWAASADATSSNVQLQLRQQLHDGAAAADVQRREPQRLRHLLAIHRDMDKLGRIGLDHRPYTFVYSDYVYTAA